MGADEIVKALRCDVEQGNEGGSQCYREGEDCRDCPNNYEGGDHIMTIDEMMLAAADAIESLQAQFATERAKYAELNRYNVDCTKQCNALLAEKLQLTDRAEKTEYKVTYTCMECGWSGTVQTIGHTVRCPHCGTANEWWQDGEEPPAAHQIKQLQAQLATSQRRERAAAAESCETCKMRDTDSYRYYTYPCRECKHRARDSYEPMERSPQEAEKGEPQ